MAKQVTRVMKIQAPGGKATPAPPIGPALGAAGVNPGQFVSKFNEMTRELNGKVVGCLITVYNDRSFDIQIKSPPASVMLKDAAGAEKGSGEPNKNKIGKVITRSQMEAIAREKMPDLTAQSMDAALRTLAGTARSMGILVDLA